MLTADISFKQKVFSELLGPVTSLETIKHPVSDCYITTCNSKFLPEIFSSGVGHDIESSQTKALVECLERITVFTYKPPFSTNSSVRRIGIDEFDLKFIDPEVELKSKRYVPDFIDVEDDKGQPAAVPSVFINREAVKDFGFTANSSGCAAGFDEEFAKINAVMELIERDAIMSQFRSGTKPQEIIIDKLDLKNQRLIQSLETLPTSDRNFKFFNLKTDSGAYVVMAACFGKKRNVPALYTACGCAFSFETALLKAIDEISLIFLYQQYNMYDIDYTLKTPEDLVVPYNYVAHAKLYYYYENLDKIVNMYTGNPTITTKELVQEKVLNFSELLKRIELNGYRTYFLKYSTRETRQLGVHIIRTIIPGFNYMNASHDEANYSPKRLAKLFGTFQVNNLPHFFP